MPAAATVTPGPDGRRVLVTGAAGFIGRWVVAALLDAGSEVLALDRSGGSGREDPVPLVEMDVCSPDIGEVMSVWRPDVVVNLAAQSRVLGSLRDPLEDLRVNVAGTVNVFEHARDHGVRAFVQASSGGTVYGDRPLGHATSESEPRTPCSPYGLSKDTADRYLAMLGDGGAVRVVSLALGNVYGPGRSGGAGPGVAGGFVDAALRGRPLRIRGDGNQTRDFVHVEDVTRAFLQACWSPVRGSINIGSGRAVSVNEIVSMIKGHLDAAVVIEHLPEVPGEVRHNRLSVVRARRLLDWSPSVDLALGIERLVTAACSAEVGAPDADRTGRSGPEDRAVHAIDA
jgi:UDP-glucose 4-epimerase